jgi:hypothetical protein
MAGDREAGHGSLRRPPEELRAPDGRPSATAAQMLHNGALDLGFGLVAVHDQATKSSSASPNGP